MDESPPSQLKIKHDQPITILAPQKAKKEPKDRAFGKQAPN